MKETVRVEQNLHKAYRVGRGMVEIHNGSPLQIKTIPYQLTAFGKKALNIGCGTKPVANTDQWINADLHGGPGIDLVFDSQCSWPMEDNSLSYIYASHVVEHLENAEAFFKEAQRCLDPGGTLLVRVPHPQSGWAIGIQDHKRPMNEEFFASLTMDFNDTNNLGEQGRTRTMQPFFYIHCLKKDTIFNKWWVPKRIKYAAIRYFSNVCDELWIYLRPFPKEATT